MSNTISSATNAAPTYNPNAVSYAYPEDASLGPVASRGGERAPLRDGWEEDAALGCDLERGVCLMPQESGEGAMSPVPVSQLAEMERAHETRSAQTKMEAMIANEPGEIESGKDIFYAIERDAHFTSYGSEGTKRIELLLGDEASTRRAIAAGVARREDAGEIDADRVADLVIDKLKTQYAGRMERAVVREVRKDVARAEAKLDELSGSKEARFKTIAGIVSPNKSVNDIARGFRQLGVEEELAGSLAKDLQGVDRSRIASGSSKHARAAERAIHGALPTLREDVGTFARHIGTDEASKHSGELLSGNAIYGPTRDRVFAEHGVRMGADGTARVAPDAEHRAAARVIADRINRASSAGAETKAANTVAGLLATTPLGAAVHGAVGVLVAHDEVQAGRGARLGASSADLVRHDENVVDAEVALRGAVVDVAVGVVATGVSTKSGFDDAAQQARPLTQKAADAARGAFQSLGDQLIVGHGRSLAADSIKADRR